MNNFNSENNDEGLNKYVAKMIVKAALKNASDATKKEVIKAINTASNEEPADDEPESDEQQVEQPAEEAPQDTMPMQENVVTKKKLKKIAESISRRLK